MKSMEKLKKLLLKHALFEKEVWRLSRAITDEIQRVLPNHRLGGWDCDKSPVGTCILSENSYDSCVYCGQPDERK